MRAETKIRNKIVRLKEILKPYNKPKVLYAGSALLVAILLIFVYWPLIIEINRTSTSLSQLQSELLSQHSTIVALEDMCAKGKIIRQNEVPTAIAALAEKGRSLGLVFRAISPGELQRTEQPGIGRSPINLAIESEYRNLGEFLAFIEELASGVMEIKNISIHSGKKTSPVLNMNLMLDLYVEIENET